jgi:hypothetical protein
MSDTKNHDGKKHLPIENIQELVFKKTNYKLYIYKYIIMSKSQ